MRLDLGHHAHYVYRAFDAEGRALYVGCTSSLKKRLAEHRRRSAWHQLAVEIQVTEHWGRRAGFGVERSEIRRLDPIYNVVGCPLDPRTGLPTNVIREAIASGELPPEPSDDDLMAWILSAPTVSLERASA